MSVCPFLFANALYSFIKDHLSLRCGKLLCPLSGGGCGLFRIVLEHFVHVLVERVLQIGRLHHYLNRHENSLDIVTWVPSSLVLIFTFGWILRLEHTKADLAVSVHIWVINFAPEDALRGHERVLFGRVRAENLDREAATLVGGARGTLDPGVKVPIVGFTLGDRDAGWHLSLHHGGFLGSPVLSLCHIGCDFLLILIKVKKLFCYQQKINKG